VSAVRTPAAKQRGFTYVGLMFAVVIIGLTLTVAAHVWRTTVQREREAELIWVGHAYRLAIASYFALGHRYPATLENLVTDDRFPVPKHHLRKLYPDPITGRNDWKLLLTPDQSGIQGVESISQLTPMKRDGFELIDALFKDADCYCKWSFVYYPYRRGLGVVTPGMPITAPLGPGGGIRPAPTGTTAAPGVMLPSTSPSPTLTPTPTTDPGSN
jgi:type II secretory pathway pseudopilin PulG